ncbi:MAG TPA: histidine kinase, partial [Erysipelotrichaceae bacterium]|nr:histidine kinase [Erysipelotrichaceae bacterium]
YAEMIRDISGDIPEKREKHLDVIIRETQYMNMLVNDMSELSKMQSGNETLNAENIDLCEIISDVVDMDAKLAEDAGIILHTEMPDHLTIFADELKITQVVANYLSNAIKHTPAGKNVYVRAWLKDDEETVRLEVADEGEGIPEEDLPYIWDRYQKSSRSFSRTMTSTGLGLSIVKAIADMHHAVCGVESKVGEGSVFWFELRETHEA